MDPATATISASLIGGAIAFVGLVISKESKISEFRQQWINAQRDDIAAYVSTMWTIQTGTTPEEAPTVLSRATELQARINLRFKYDDNDSKALMDALQTLLKAANPAIGVDAFTPIVNRAIDEAQQVLRVEWLKVKNGERVYRATWFLMILFITVVIAFLLWRI